MIKHVLADGTVLESVEGRVIPPTGKTEAVYRLLAESLAKGKAGAALDPQDKHNK